MKMLKPFDWNNHIDMHSSTEQKYEIKPLKRLSDGSLYQGEWLNDQINRRGIKIFPDSARYEGFFKDGKAHGLGRIIPADGKIIIFEGLWLNDQKHGSGKEKYIDGSQFEGSWVKGKKHGEGIKINKYGVKSIQTWTHGQKIIRIRSMRTL